MISCRFFMIFFCLSPRWVEEMNNFVVGTTGRHLHCLRRVHAREMGSDTHHTQHRCVFPLHHFGWQPHKHAWNASSGKSLLSMLSVWRYIESTAIRYLHIISMSNGWIAWFLLRLITYEHNYWWLDGRRTRAKITSTIQSYYVICGRCLISTERPGGPKGAFNLVNRTLNPYLVKHIRTYEY